MPFPFTKMKSWLRLLGLKSLISVLRKHWCKVYLIHFLIIMVNYYIQFRTAVQVQAAKKILVVAIISDSSQVSTSLCEEEGSTSRSTSLYQYITSDNEGVTLHPLGFGPATYINITQPGLGRKSNLTWNPRWSPIQIFSNLDVA